MTAVQRNTSLPPNPLEQRLVVDPPVPHSRTPLHASVNINTMSYSQPLLAPQPVVPRPLFTSRPIPPLLSHSISTPTYPASSSFPIPLPHSHSLSNKARPKPLKKPSTSTPTKHKSVQLSLEVKVERAKGFHAFFVPLARSLPPAPPSSPVLHPREEGDGAMASPKGVERREERSKSSEERSKDGEAEGMEVDAE